MSSSPPANPLGLLGQRKFPPSAPPPLSTREAWRASNLACNDTFVQNLPKIELHVHLEGTLSPALRWELAAKNGVELVYGPEKKAVRDEEHLRELYRNIRGRIGAGSAAGGHEGFTFFEAYYGGFEVLVTEEDFFRLAMGYFREVAGMGVKYAEVFFDLQGHLRRGINERTVMEGLRRAKDVAENELGIKSGWIFCILRDLSPESAMEAYSVALDYQDLIIGIGLDSDELHHPPSLFEEVFRRARRDGLKITAHCDFDQVNTHEHIRQVLTTMGGSGADRCDHGMNVADGDELIDMIKMQSKKGMGLTLCPCAYIRNKGEHEVFGRMRKLVDADVRISIASDDPAYMGQNWVLHNLLLLKYQGGFSNEELIKFQWDAVEMIWATKEVKTELRRQIDEFVAAFRLRNS